MDTAITAHSPAAVNPIVPCTKIAIRKIKDPATWIKKYLIMLSATCTLLRSYIITIKDIKLISKPAQIITQDSDPVIIMILNKRATPASKLTCPTFKED